MKILFVMHNLGYFNRHFDRTIRCLCQQGHTVNLLTGTFPAKTFASKYNPLSLLQTRLQEIPHLQHAQMLVRHDRWENLIGQSRRLRDYANFLRPEHPSPHLRVRREGLLNFYLRMFAKSRVGQVFLSSSLGQNLLQTIEERIPPDAFILQWLETARPDVVVASPYLMPNSGEVEYLKAARALKIPAVAILASWDNLTTKGTFHVVPDLFVVWNRALAEEAVRLYGLSGNHILITGAPTFDFWFELKPTIDRSTFVAQVGLDGNGPYIVYLCSSTTIVDDETGFVREIRKTLNAHPATRNVKILVRPHPLNAHAWVNFYAENIVVWPQTGALPDALEAQQDYYNTLYYSLAVVGLNTSAFIDAAIIDRPCFTIVNDQFRTGQMGMGHFKHLLDGDFIEVTSDPDNFAIALKSVLEGNDIRQHRRQAFVHNFVRPRGRDRSVDNVIASVIIQAGQRTDGPQIAESLNRLDFENV